MPDSKSDSFGFEDVLRHEVDLLLGSTEGAGKAAGNDYDRAHESDLTGLAFSGGGIRSATFNLGIIQGLSRVRRGDASPGLLSRFDYLSTVSGGGYIGCWFSAWLHRAARKRRANAGFLDRFQKRISTRPCGFGPMRGTDGDACKELSGYRNQGSITTSGFPPLEHAAVRYLRRYSNYLAPRVGFSGDVLALVSLFLRNLVLLQLALVTLAAAVLLAPYVIAAFSSLIAHFAALEKTVYSVAVQELVLGIGILLLLVALVFCSRQLKVTKKDHGSPGGEPAVERKQKKRIKLKNAGMVAVCAFASWMIIAGAIVIEGMGPFVNYIGLGAVTYTVAWGLGYVAYAYFPRIRKTSREDGARVRFAASIAVTVVSGAVFGLLAYLCGIALKTDWAGFAGNRLAMITFGPPVVMLVISLVVTVHIGVARDLFTDLQREWWARLGGFVLYAIVAWVVLFTIAFYTPPLGQWLGNGGIAAVLAWAGASGAGALIGRNAATVVDDRKPPLVKSALMRLSPWLFVIGLALIVSFAVNRALIAGLKIEVAWPDGVSFSTALWLSAQEFAQIFAVRDVLGITGPWSKVVPATIAFFAALAVFMAISARLDLNIFSAHRLYRNRLTRAYLGASRAGKRNSHPFSGFDDEDDVQLASLAEQRPIPILNTTINMTGGDDLAWQTRRAASFPFTPHFVGYETKSSQGTNIGAFRRTLEFASGDESGATASVGAGGRSGSTDGGGLRLNADRDKRSPGDGDGEAVPAVAPGGLSLGTVMAISGAAASPNMGYHTSPAIAALLTAFNLRLGYWAGNPCEQPEWRSGDWDAWKKDRPSAVWPIFNELTGSASAESAWINLSDGGHFDNLGVYELVRRRCRFIVVTDAGSDPDHEFQDLANTIRKCWTDLGVHIFFHDLNKLAIKKGERFCERHGSLGLIEYPDRQRDERERYGLILYLKCSLTQQVYDKYVDIRQYADAKGDFPHQTTIDQFFDEEQFEAYRHLGFCVAEEHRPVISRFFDPATGKVDQRAVAAEADRIRRIQRSSATPEGIPMGVSFSYTESVRMF